jgi:MFS family permease
MASTSDGRTPGPDWPGADPHAAQGPYASDGPPTLDEPAGPPPPRRGARLAAGLRRTGRTVARGGVGAYSGARRFTHAGGAGESGLSRLLELHAFNTAGDAAIAVSLAGTLFFTVPTEQASGQVALFLVLTMLPFAFVAPLIGPFLDRFRRGRRWAIGSTLAIRGFCCWVLAGAVADESAAFYLAALGCLVASKAYGVTRASAVPRLLPEEFTLVKANSRISLTGTAAAAISAPLAVGAAAIGPEWSLRYAFVLFVVGTVLAILLPSRVDSSEGEQRVDLSDLAELGGRGNRPGIDVSRHVVDALRSNAGLRLITGFLTIFMAFTLREPPASLGWTGNATLLMGLVIGAAGAGNTLGVVIGSWTRSRSPHRVVLAVLLLDITVLVAAAAFFRWPVAALLGLSVGLCQSLGKLSLDALIQRDIGEEKRTSMFARSETLLQLSWVIGGLIGIGLFTFAVDVTVAMFITAGIVVAWGVFVLRQAVTGRDRDAGRRTASTAPVDDVRP